MKRFDLYPTFGREQIERIRYHAKPLRAVATALVTGVGGPVRLRKGVLIVRPVVFLRAVG
jgi:hypothetical protein